MTSLEERSAGQPPYFFFFPNVSPFFLYLRKRRVTSPPEQLLGLRRGPSTLGWLFFYLPTCSRPHTPDLTHPPPTTGRSACFLFTPGRSGAFLRSRGSQ